MTTIMSKTAKELRHQEEIIQDGMKSFLHVGRALIAIRDQSLYEEKYETFEAYCKSRWSFSSNYAYRLMNSAEIVNEMLPIGNTAKSNPAVLPANEAQARAIATAADTPEDRAKVWKAAVAKAPKNSADEPVVTAKLVKEAAEELLGPTKPLAQQDRANKTKPKPEPTAKPGCGTSFDPAEFDPDIEPQDRQSSASDPKHLAPVLEGLKQYKSLQRELSLLFGKVEELAKRPIGSYIQLQEIQRHIDQVKADLKAYSFGDNCPTCRNNPSKSCQRCKGRGWIAHAQMGQLSDLDKTWLETNSVKP